MTDSPDGLRFADLRRADLARQRRWHKGDVNDWSLSDWAVAAAGEMGEMCNVVKKLNRVRDGIVGNDIGPEALRRQLADEIADVVIYLDLLAASEGIDLAAAVADVFNRKSQQLGFPERLPAAPFDIEQYIRDLPWTADASDDDKTLVAGNLRTLYHVLRGEIEWESN